MCDAPSLRNIIIKFLCQFFGCLSRNGISPGPERNQQFSVFVKSKITVHHGGNSDARKSLYGYVVFLGNIS